MSKWQEHSINGVLAASVQGGSVPDTFSTAAAPRMNAESSACSSGWRAKAAVTRWQSLSTLSCWFVPVARWGMKKQNFKPYTPKQAMLLPPSLEEMIPEGHLVRVVDEMIERLNIDPLKKQYTRRGNQCLSSPNAVKNARVCIYPGNVLFPKDSQSAERRHPLHAV